MRARAAALGLIAVGAIGVAAWAALRDGRRAPVAEDGEPTTDVRAPSPASLAASGSALAPAVRRVTLRLTGVAPAALVGASVGFVSRDGDRIDRERGTFSRHDDGATPAFVCDDPRPLPSARGVEALVVRPGSPSVRVPLDVPRSAGGGFADAFDVVATADLSALATVVGRVRSSSGPGVPDLRVALLGPPRPRSADAVPAVRARPSQVPPAPPPPGSQPEDPAADRPTLGVAETDADGRFSVAVRLAAGDAVEGRVVARVPRTRVTREVRLSAPVVLRGADRVTVPDLIVEEGAVIDGRLLVSPKEPPWTEVRALSLVDTAPSDYTDPWSDPARLARSSIADDDTFRLTGIPAGPCLLSLELPHGPHVPIHPDVTAAGRAIVTAPATALTLGTPSRSLTFRVEDADGGVGKALVRIDGRVGSLVLTTHDDGYADAIVPAGAPLALTVASIGHSALATTLDAASASDPVRLRLEQDPEVKSVARDDLLEDGRRPFVAAEVGRRVRNFVSVACRVRDATGQVVECRFAEPTWNAVCSWRGILPPLGGLLLEPSAPGRYTLEITDPRFEAEPVELIVRATIRPDEGPSMVRVLVRFR